ncbi:VC0807 family protein [Aquitalea sp. ASV11]|uniref:VC0807 family protein n=1 Tax=Aquitalea sp. ASV11 TaxID=2795103 RepID=UPI0018ECA483|nr:VC0807 family protein [Aquitalea sp. ASV11]
MTRLYQLLPELLANVVLPWLCYRWAQPQWGETAGLIASSLPPIAWSVVELLRFRRIDALSLLVLGGIALSLLAILLGGSPRVLLMRESLLSGLIGLAFLLSLLLPKPLLFYLARATVARESAEGEWRFDVRWQEAAFRRGIRQLTLLWGGGLCAETLLRALLIWQLPVERFLIVSPFVSYGIMGLLLAGTWLGRRRLRANSPLSVS